MKVYFSVFLVCFLTTGILYGQTTNDELSELTNPYFFRKFFEEVTKLGPYFLKVGKGIFWLLIAIDTIWKCLQWILSNKEIKDFFNEAIVRAIYYVFSYYLIHSGAGLTGEIVSGINHMAELASGENENLDLGKLVEIFFSIAGSGCGVMLIGMKSAKKYLVYTTSLIAIILFVVSAIFLKILYIITLIHVEVYFLSCFSPLIFALAGSSLTESSVKSFITHSVAVGMKYMMTLLIGQIAVQVIFSWQLPQGDPSDAAGWFSKVYLFLFSIGFYLKAMEEIPNNLASLFNRGSAGLNGTKGEGVNNYLASTMKNIGKGLLEVKALSNVSKSANLLAKKQLKGVDSKKYKEALKNSISTFRGRDVKERAEKLSKVNGKTIKENIGLARNSSQIALKDDQIVQIARDELKGYNQYSKHLNAKADINMKKYGMNRDEAIAKAEQSLEGVSKYKNKAVTDYLDKRKKEIMDDQLKSWGFLKDPSGANKALPSQIHDYGENLGRVKTLDTLTNADKNLQPYLLAEKKARKQVEKEAKAWNKSDNAPTVHYNGKDLNLKGNIYNNQYRRRELMRTASIINKAAWGQKAGDQIKTTHGNAYRYRHNVLSRLAGSIQDNVANYSNKRANMVGSNGQNLLSVGRSNEHQTVASLAEQNAILSARRASGGASGDLKNGNNPNIRQRVNRARYNLMIKNRNRDR